MWSEDLKGLKDFKIKNHVLKMMKKINELGKPYFFYFFVFSVTAAIGYIFNSDFFVVLITFVSLCLWSLFFSGKISFYIFSKSNKYVSSSFLEVLFELAFVCVIPLAIIVIIFYDISPISFVFMLLSGFYLALKKNFLIISNKKYNIFMIRLLFTIPGSIMLSFLISLVATLLFGLFLKYIAPFDEYFPILLILSSLFLIFSFKKYFIRNDVPPEYDPNFMNYDLYVFLPFQKVAQRPYNQFGIPPGIRLGTDLFVGIQKEDLKLHYKSLLGKDIVFTDFGELIVSEKAFLRFSEYGFNDLFETRRVQAVGGMYYKRSIRPVRALNPSPYDLKEKYYQLFPTHTMPPFDPKTEIKKVDIKILYSAEHYAVDNKFCYNQKVMENVFDFNVTFEILGSNDGFPYFPHKLWVVTKKTMELLLTEFNQNKRDFIPIMLIDNETDVKRF